LLGRNHEKEDCSYECLRELTGWMTLWGVLSYNITNGIRANTSWNYAELSVT